MLCEAGTAAKPGGMPAAEHGGGSTEGYKEEGRYRGAAHGPKPWAGPAKKKMAHSEAKEEEQGSLKDATA